MSLLRSSIRTAGRSIFHATPSSFNRLYSAVAALTREDIEKRVLGVLKAFDRVDQNKISISSDFTSDLGLDSLDVVEVMIAIEEEFNMEIPDDVADKCRTPQDAVEYVLGKQDSPTVI